MNNLLLAVAFIFTAHISIGQVPEKAEDISPLLIGETVGESMLIDIDNKTVSLSTILAVKPTVLVFYRGGWCPYCNVQLSALAQSEDEILKLGYQIIGISNEDFQNIAPSVEQDKIKYSVYSDPESKLIQQMGIGFKVSERSKSYIAKKSKGTISDILPVPSVFILDIKGKILFEYINPDYKTRMSDALLMGVLKLL